MLPGRTAIYDIRCKDVARFLSTGPKTLDEIGNFLLKLYPKSKLDPKGTWIRDVLVEWNPLVVKTENGKYMLSDLGRAFISLPGREGADPTPEEKAFILGLMVQDKEQGKVVSAIILGLDPKNYIEKNGWTIQQTETVLTWVLQ